MPHADLIIDDETTLAENIQTKCLVAAMTCAVGSGRQGLTTLEEFKPDLVLLDSAAPSRPRLALKMLSYWRAERVGIELGG